MVPIVMPMYNVKVVVIAGIIRALRISVQIHMQSSLTARLAEIRIRQHIARLYRERGGGQQTDEHCRQNEERKYFLFHVILLF